MKTIVLLTFCLFTFSNSYSQKNWENYFEQKYSSLCRADNTFREYNLQLSKSGNLYDFMSLSNMLAPLVNLYHTTGKEEYLNDGIKIINNVIGKSKVSKSISGNKYELKDNYLSWISLTPAFSYYSEGELYEGYIFRYVVQLLYEVKQSGWKDISAKNQDWYTSTLQFVEKNIWEKWISRSLISKATPYGIFLGTRTHMASHWAHIGLLLKELTSNTTIKTQCQNVVDMFDLLLTRNFKPNPSAPEAYTWNSTWDDVSGTQAQTSKTPSIQDVSHGNQVISYIAIAKRLNNPHWTDARLKALCNTVKKVMFKRKTITFTDNVDGTASISRPGYGNSQAEGWVMLSLFDTETLNIYLDFALRQVPMLEKYGQEMEYYANLALIEFLIAQ